MPSNGPASYGATQSALVRSATSEQTRGIHNAASVQTIGTQFFLPQPFVSGHCAVARNAMINAMTTAVKAIAAILISARSPTCPFNTGMNQTGTVIGTSFRVLHACSASSSPFVSSMRTASVRVTARPGDSFCKRSTWRSRRSSRPFGSLNACVGYFPPPPHDRSGVAGEQALMIALGSARIAPCSASPSPGLRPGSPIWQPGR